MTFLEDPRSIGWNMTTKQSNRYILKKSSRKVVHIKDMLEKLSFNLACQRNSVSISKNG